MSHYQGKNWIGVPLSGGGIGESYQRGKNEGNLSGEDEWGESLSKKKMS